LDGLTYDLEPLSPGAGQRKAEAGWSGPTSISGKSLKAFFAFGDFSEMTSRDYPPELDKEKRSRLGWPDKHKMNGPKKAYFAIMDHLADDLEGQGGGCTPNE
jgi:hypothetical protein